MCITVLCIRFYTLTYGHYIYSLWATSPNLISWQIDSEWHCISLPGPYLIPQPTGCEWYFVCSLKGSFIQITSHDQQGVGVITFFLLQAVSCKCHPTTNSMSVSVYFSLPTGLIWISNHTNREWVLPYIFLPGSLIQTCFMANREWVTLHFLLARQFH